MGIFFIWLTILCCGAANGFLFEHYGMPENFIFMLIPSLVCVLALCWHRKITKSWEPPLDKWDWDKYHFPIFWVSMCIFAVIFLFLTFMHIPHKGGILISLGTVIIASFVAYIRESRYTANWII